MVVSEVLPRSAFVVLAHVAKPVGTGLGSQFCAGISRTAALLAAAQGIVISLLAGPLAAVAMATGTGLIILMARMYFHKRIGGVTGDCLGSTGQLVQCFCLLTFVCLRSI
jgi:adenosylcobinamide-GDP ribazoletransferase